MSEKTGCRSVSHHASEPTIAHTPGPWTAKRGSLNVDVDSAWGDIVESSHFGFSVATVWNDVDELTQHATANATLIAAAPELLAALKELRDGAYGNPNFPSENSAIDARADRAIAKAEGRS